MDSWKIGVIAKSVIGWLANCEPEYDLEEEITWYLEDEYVAAEMVKARVLQSCNHWDDKHPELDAAVMEFEVFARAVFRNPDAVYPSAEKPEPVMEMADFVKLRPDDAADLSGNITLNDLENVVSLTANQKIDAGKHLVDFSAGFCLERENRFAINIKVDSVEELIELVDLLLPMENN